MAVDTQLSNRQIRTAFVLEVDGLEQRYFCGAQPPAASPYEYVEGIIGVSETTESIETLGGIVDASGCTVTIANSVENAAATKLCRIGKPAWRSELTSSIDAEASTDPIGFDDTTGLASSGVVWLGQEAIAFTGNTGTSITGTTRGYYGSPIQEHKVDADQGWAPIGTDSLEAWRNRPARVLVANITPDGALDTNWIEHIDGFLDRPPELSADGLSIDIEIVPWVSRLRDTLGNNSERTTLATGYHYFEASSCNKIRMQQAWPRGNVLSGPGTTTTNSEIVNATDIETDNFSVDEYERVFDDSQDWPRYARLHIKDYEYEVDSVDAVGDKFVISRLDGETGTGLYETTVAGATPIENAETPDFHEYDIYDASFTTSASVGEEKLIRWPQQLFDEWNTAQPGTNQGAAGAWADVEIRSLAFYPIEDYDGARAGPALLAKKNSIGGTFLRFEFVPRYGDLWYGLRFSKPGGPIYRPDSQIGDVVESASIAEENERFVIAAGENVEPQVFPFSGWARAFYQQGEKYALLRDNIIGSTGAVSTTRWIRVTYNDDETAEEKVTYFRVANIAAVSDGSTIGYAYEVQQQDRGAVVSFGNWGQDAPRIEQIVRWRDAQPADMMLEMMLSRQGNGFVDATYDVQPYGLGLPSQAINVASFERFPIVPGFDRWTFELEDEIAIDELFGGLLSTQIAGIVQRASRNDGNREIVMLPIGLATSFEAIQDFADGDFLVRPRPASGTDYEIKNVHRFKTNWDDRDDKFHVTVTYRDVPSIQRHGEAPADDLELKGVDVEENDPNAQLSLFRPVFDERRALYGAPRRVYTCSVSWSDAVMLYAGSVVTITADDALDLDGTAGITSRAARIKRVRLDPWNQEAEFDAEVHGNNPTGWAPALSITSGAAASTDVTVAANAYTEASDPFTDSTQTDLEYAKGDDPLYYFVAGDTVFLVPRGNYGGKVSATIDSINYTTRVVTFTGAVTIATGSTIRPQDYDDASTAHQAYAYLADANSTIGSGNAEAYEYD